MSRLIKRLTLSFFLCSAFVLSGCIPREDLPVAHKKPPVTGPFDLYFPEAEKVFTGPQTVNELKAKTRVKTEESAIVPLKGDLNIGLLIPKTGASKELGADFEDAAILALYDAKMAFPGGYRLTLIPKDTASSPSVAVQSAKELLSQKINIIIGPLYSQSTEAVVESLTPDLLLSLSNNTEAASGTAFITGFSPESEMERALTYAMKQNKQHVAAILPNNAYGRKLERVIKRIVPGFGASIDAIEFYVPTEGGREAAVKRLANQIKGANTDVICFGDTKTHSAEIIDIIASEGINTNGLTKVGTSIWHDENEKMPKQLNDSIYAASDERGYIRFMKRFRSTHERKPERIATLVYDMVMLLAELASKGNIPTRQDLMAAEIIQGPATGAYRFETDGTVTRSLSLYTLTPEGFDVVENAPKEF